MTEWSKLLVSFTSHSMAWVWIPLLSCYTVTKSQFYLPGNNSKIINNIPSTVIDYICSMAEWSKVLVTDTFDGMGSDKTPLMLHCYKLTVLAAEKQFENNKQHTFNCTDYICMKAEWSKCAGFSY